MSGYFCVCSFVSEILETQHHSAICLSGLNGGGKSILFYQVNFYFNHAISVYDYVWHFCVCVSYSLRGILFNFWWIEVGRWNFVKLMNND